MRARTLAVAALLAVGWMAPAGARAQLSAPHPSRPDAQPVAPPAGGQIAPPPAPPGVDGGAVEGPEPAEGLAEPEPGVTAPRRPAGRGEPHREPEEPWTGPRVELGYAHYAIVDGFGGGDVNAGLFGGYLDTGVARLGASLELGARDYALAQDDAVVRASILAGYQHLDWAPFVPYAGAVATVGWVIGKRFRTPVSRTLWGGGLEIGADVNLVRSLYVGVGLSYLRIGLSGTGRDLWVLRLRVGL